MFLHVLWPGIPTLFICTTVPYPGCHQLVFISCRILHISHWAFIVTAQKTFPSKQFNNCVFIGSTNFNILLPVSATHGSRIEKAFFFFFNTKFTHSCLWKYLQLAIQILHECKSSIAMIVLQFVAKCGRFATAWQASLRIPESTEPLSERHGLPWS